MFHPRRIDQRLPAAIIGWSICRDHDVRLQEDGYPTMMVFGIVFVAVGMS
ncbi:MAG: hypothetical protein ACLR0N_17970 [Bilophila wadsworthia]